MEDGVVLLRNCEKVMRVGREKVKRKGPGSFGAGCTGQGGAPERA